MGTKPPAAVDVRIYMDGRHDLNAAAPHSTTLTSLQGMRAGGSAFMPKLVELVGPGSTWRAEEQSPCIACAAVAAPSTRSRVLVLACPSASMARRDCSVLLMACQTLVHLLRNFVQHLVPSIESFIQPLTYILQRGLARPKFFLAGGRGHCPQGQPRFPSMAC